MRVWLVVSALLAVTVTEGRRWEDEREEAKEGPLLGMLQMLTKRGDTEGCGEYEFRCASGGCVPDIFRCDWRGDCADASDERDCRNCTDSEFACTKNSFTLCLQQSQVCDEFAQCDGGEDEANCDVATCKDGFFQCPIGGVQKCIPEKYKCDGKSFCDHGEDELKFDCPEPVCADDQFMCQGHYGEDLCFNDDFWCDGEVQCKGRVDELNFPNCTATLATFKGKQTRDRKQQHLVRELTDLVKGGIETIKKSFL